MTTKQSQQAGFDTHWYAQKSSALGSIEAKRHFDAGVEWVKSQAHEAEAAEYIVTVATTKAPQGALQIPVLATDRDDAQDKAIDWMEFMGITHGEVLKVVLKGEAA